MSDSYSQKRYNYKIIFTDSAINRKIDIGFYQGYQTLPIPVGSTSEIIGSTTSFLKYPVLEIFYFSSLHKPTIYRYFLLRHSFKITIKYHSQTDDISVQHIAGLLNFDDAGKNEFEIFAKQELKQRDTYAEAYNNDFTNLDSSILRQFEAYSAIVKEKSLEFIKNHPRQLYSVRLFMDEIIGDPRFSIEHLSSIYSKYLRHRYQNSFEEKFIAEKLDASRLGINSKAPAQDVAFKDLKGKSHTIKSFKGKPLLINIWATWCVPCVAEIPKLKQLYGRYKDQMQMLSFSPEIDTVKVKKFIDDQKIDWINVGNRLDMCNLYGQDKGLPQVFLLDQNGSIIYSRIKYEDYELNKLKRILEKIFSNE